jgi:hypothetical protein
LKNGLKEENGDMKIRTDFVTNSSSSCFCAVTVTLKDGTKLRWEDHPLRDYLAFDPIHIRQERLRAIREISDLLDFLAGCTQESSFAEEFESTCAELIRSIQEAGSIDNIASLEMSCNEFMSDQGEFPEDGATGRQLKFYFDTGACEITNRPTDEFIDLMNSIYDYS